PARKRTRLHLIHLIQCRPDVVRVAGYITEVSAPVLAEGEGLRVGPRIFDAACKFVGKIDMHPHHWEARDIAFSGKSFWREGIAGATLIKQITRVAEVGWGLRPRARGRALTRPVTHEGISFRRGQATVLLKATDDGSGVIKFQEGALLTDKGIKPLG